MHVIATAGHVDHGKSTLVRALTGQEPDRLTEEHRRGLSIELGYVWTDLPGAGEFAFVDVPGHERFVATMLAGLGPVPAVLFVVAADDPWMPQAAEHLAAIDAWGVTHGVLAVTRADLADPGPALRVARGEIRRTSLGEVVSVAVSGRTGEGLAALRSALVDLTSQLPDPPATSDVRLWVDRVFHARGAGTVVTGTLPAGTVAVGDILSLDGTPLRVRGVQTLGRDVTSVRGVSRAALNLVGVHGKVPDELSRGSVLVTPGVWPSVCTVDVRLNAPGRLPERPLLHVGAAAVSAHVRPLDEWLLRLSFDRPLPLRVGDRGLLRDPGSRAVWGVTVLDPEPPPLRRRGAGARRAKELAGADGSVGNEVTRRGLMRRSRLVRLGVDVSDVPLEIVPYGDWLMSRAWRHDIAARLADEVTRRTSELAPGVPVAEVARALDLPDPDLVAALVEPPLRVSGGRILTGEQTDSLPAALTAALDSVRSDLTDNPFAAPGTDRLRALGLDRRSIGLLARTGRVLRVADDVVLLPGADTAAVEVLRELPQPFTTSQARESLGTSRRVALPLLAHLDRLGLTHRLPDDRRTTTPVEPSQNPR